MHSTTATRTSTDSADGELTRARPRIGLLGIMQSLYDDMLPGIAERQAGYAAEVAAALEDVADVHVAPPVKEREDAERAMRELHGEDLDGLLVVMLTYGPAMRVARLLAETPLPIFSSLRSDLLMSGFRGPRSGIIDVQTSPPTVVFRPTSLVASPSKKLRIGPPPGPPVTGVPPPTPE